MYFSHSPTLDFNKEILLLNNDTDVEVSIHRSLVVMEAQCDILEHGLYTTIDSANCY